MQTFVLVGLNNENRSKFDGQCVPSGQYVETEFYRKPREMKCSEIFNLGLLRIE